VPLVEQARGSTCYDEIPEKTRAVATRLLAICKAPDTYTTLSPADLAALGIPPAALPLTGAARRERDLKIAELVAALFCRTGVEWSADIAVDDRGGCFYSVVRGTVDLVHPLEELGVRDLHTVGGISHCHPGGTPEPSFGDLTVMALVRPVARRLGFEPDNDDIIVVNQPRQNRFTLVRYEHAFRD
jgi:hypothetical protein